jgi:hypothetical protein
MEVSIDSTVGRFIDEKRRAKKCRNVPLLEGSCLEWGGKCKQRNRQPQSDVAVHKWVSAIFMEDGMWAIGF